MWKFVRLGFYRRRIEPLRVQRYRCDACRRNFGDQTFRTTYWLHRPELLLPVFWRINACSGFRQIAREVKAAASTIARHSDRLGRHSFLFHELVRPKGPLMEPLAADGFESFEYSQYYPTSWHVVAGQRTHYFYGFTDSERRRGGTMTAAQRARRSDLEARLGKPDPRSVEIEMAAVLAIVTAGCAHAEIHTDEHKSYPRAIRRLRGLLVTHRTISSRAARTTNNPLYAINLLDLVLRHNGAAWKRETIAFPKRTASAANTMATLLVWHNYVQPFSTRRGGATPAMLVGILDRPLAPEEILVERLFVTRSTLPARWRDYYWRRLPTRAMPNGRSHSLRYAA